MDLLLDIFGFVSVLLYFACMKNRMTSVALVIAMPIATGKFRAPKLWVATSTVRIVSTISDPKIV